MDETIRVVRVKPLTLIITLPDGCTPGRWEAVEEFSLSFALLQKEYPDRKFQLLPYSYETDSTNAGLSAIMAVEI